MLRRTCVLLLAGLALAGCTPSNRYGTNTYSYRPPAPAIPPSTRMAEPSPTVRQNSGRVAILLPLTGSFAEIGQAMLRAAQLALPEGGSPTLYAFDTGGTPEGASIAAKQAVSSDYGLILGPLTAAETAAVAPIAREAGVAVLAFTNDPAQGQPGVWPMGIGPAQQVRRMVFAAAAQEKTRSVALLPDSDFGRVMGNALRQAATARQLPPPDIRFHIGGMAAITQEVRDLSGYASRRGPIDAQIKASRAEGTPEGRRRAQELAKSRIEPPPFDMLLLADTGEPLSLVASMLSYFDVDPHAVQIMGPAQWASSASGSGEFPGAWYAAPDPASRAAFDVAYNEKYGSRPPAIADLAYDAATMARVLSDNGGFSIRALTDPRGLAGADGWFGLLPDGEVRRALAIFRIERGGVPSMVEPAPSMGDGSGS